MHKKRFLMNIEFVLIRHGQTIYNREGRIQGHLNSDLTEEGIAEIRLLGRWMKQHLNQFDYWFCSPMPRAMITSQILREVLAQKVDPASQESEDPEFQPISLPQERTDERIKEISCGEYEGKTIQEMSPELLQKLRTDSSTKYPGGGESIEDVIVRVGGFLREVEGEIRSNLKKIDDSSQSSYDDSPTNQKDRSVRVVIVSHGNANRCMAAALTGLGGPFALTVMQQNTGFSRLRTSPSGSGYRLLTWNETPHLKQSTPGKTV